MVTWAGVPLERLRIVSGNELLERYASSQEAKRSFCRRCGSSLFFESTRWPDEVHVAVANLDSMDRPVSAHVFFDDRAPWLELGEDSLPRFGGKTGVEPLG